MEGPASIFTGLISRTTRSSIATSFPCVEKRCLAAVRVDQAKSIEVENGAAKCGRRSWADYPRAKTTKRRGGCLVDQLLGAAEGDSPTTPACRLLLG